MNEKRNLKGLKDFLRTQTLDDNIKFDKKIIDEKLYAKLDSGKRVYWRIGNDFIPVNCWYNEDKNFI